MSCLPICFPFSMRHEDEKWIKEKWKQKKNSCCWCFFFSVFLSFTRSFPRDSRGFVYGGWEENINNKPKLGKMCSTACRCVRIYKHNHTTIPEYENVIQTIMHRQMKISGKKNLSKSKQKMCGKKKCFFFGNYWFFFLFFFLFLSN